MSDVTKERSDALKAPPPQAVCAALGIDAIEIDWLAGDGSDRCYYRLRSPEIMGSHVLMQLSENDAKALREDGYDWAKIADLLSKRGIFIPKIIAKMPKHAALIIEDYGNDMLEKLVHEHMGRKDHKAIVKLYRECFEILAKFLTIKPRPEESWCRRSFDQERLNWELEFFWQKYGQACLKLELSASEREQFQKDSQALSAYLAGNAHYFVHRDFHSRNILHLKERLAIIDFQDARLGAAAYDLVSLCFDSYVPFSTEVRHELLDLGIDLIAAERGEKVASDLSLYWRPTLLQRQLKAIGSFGYLTVDQKRGDYLRYVSPALQTLEGSDLFDERWPFLSGALIQKLREAHA